MLSRRGHLQRVFRDLAAEHRTAIAGARRAIQNLHVERTTRESGLDDIARAFRESRLSASYLGLDAARDVADVAGRLITRDTASGAQPSPHTRDALSLALDFVAAELDAACDHVRPANEAITRDVLRTLQACVASEHPHGDVDSEDFTLFVADAQRLVAQYRDALLSAVAHDDSGRFHHIDAAFRAAHTLKGNAGLMGLAPLEGLARTAEQALDGVRAGRLTLSAAFTVALVDVVERAVEAVARPVPFDWDHETSQLEVLLAEAQDVAQRTRIGELLVERSVVSREFVELALALRSAPLGEALVRMRALSAEDLNETLDVQKRLRSGEPVQPLRHNPQPRPHSESVDALRLAQAKLLAADARAALARSSEQDPAQTCGTAELARQVSRLCECVESLDHVSVKPVFRKAHKAALDASKRLQKPLRFEVTGDDFEARPAVLDALGDALVHLVRNAVDHGIEPRSERLSAGKPAEAKLTVRAQRERDTLTVEVRDDGRGLQRQRILAKAIERELVDASSAAALRDDDVFAFVFEPGFSTALDVTDVSGRGVGMDAVRHAVTQLGGEVSLLSNHGDGTIVRIAIPYAGHASAVGTVSDSWPPEFGMDNGQEKVRYGA